MTNEEPITGSAPASVEISDVHHRDSFLRRHGTRLRGVPMTLDPDLQKRLEGIFRDALNLSQNLHIPFALDRLSRQLAQAEEVLIEQGHRMRQRPHYGG